MDSLMLARSQFAITTIYHFFFVPLTLGLSVFLAIFETMYVVTGNEVYKRLTKFWGKLFLINFAMGVVTGIVQEFQFGMNWSQYSRFVGDIFGVPLAIEALLAFFLESTFLGIWIFGWDKLSKKLHLATIWLVAIGSHLSAFFILMANSFMQQPTGFTLRNGRAEMTDFGALVTNPHLWLQFPHVAFAGLSTAAFFIIGICAWHFINKNHTHANELLKSFKIAALLGTIAIFCVAVVGHFQGQYLIKHQPMKMAAAEALWETEDPASLKLFSVPDIANRKDYFSVSVPYALSFLAQNSLKGKVIGMNELQATMESQYGKDDYTPPVALSFYSFRVMVGCGVAMWGLGLICLLLIWQQRVHTYQWFLKILILALFLPYLANSTGWILTEMGRQPWVVYGVLKTRDGVSPAVSAGMLGISLAVFTALYGALMAVDVWLLYKFAKKGPVLEIDEPV